MSLDAGLAIGAIVVGAIVWFVRLEGRVNLHDEMLRQIREDVRYIRQQIDDVIRGR